MNLCRLLLVLKRETTTLNNALIASHQFKGRWGLKMHQQRSYPACQPVSKAPISHKDTDIERNSATLTADKLFHKCIDCCTSQNPCDKKASSTQSASCIC
jgi:hypothetical protein